MRRGGLGSLAALVCSFAAIAHSDQGTPPSIHFVRGGVVVPDGWIAAGSRDDLANLTDEAQTLGDGRILWPLEWKPGQSYSFTLANQAEQPITRRAPRVPTPWVICRVPLEDVSAAALAGATPDAVVRFDPEGRRVAVGTFGGWLRIIDVITGRVLHRRRVSEGMVKTLGWSPDGRRLFVGEQSPDAWLMAIDVPAADDDGYRVAWQVRLADVVESSRLAYGERYSVYTLPAVFDLKISQAGDLFLIGLHSWSTEEGWRTRSVVASYAHDGRRRWRFPDQDADERVVRHLSIDASGSRVAFLTAPTPPSAGGAFHPGGELIVLNGDLGLKTGVHQIEPLSPHFDRVDAWDSIALSADGTRLALGLADGRGWLFGISKEGEIAPAKELAIGSPVVIGGLPIAAPCSYTRRTGSGFIFQTQQSHIPFSNAQTSFRPQSPHPRAETLTMTDSEGRVQWRYRGPYSPAGFWESRSEAAERVGVVTCRERLGGDADPADTGHSHPGPAHGFLLFRLDGMASGRDRLLYHYPTEGPLTNGADISADGRFVAVIEVPTPTADGEDLYGTHQLHIVR